MDYIVTFGGAFLLFCVGSALAYWPARFFCYFLDYGSQKSQRGFSAFVALLFSVFSIVCGAAEAWVSVALNGYVALIDVICTFGGIALCLWVDRSWFFRERV